MTTDAVQPGSRPGSPLEASIHAASIDPLGDRLHLWAAIAFLSLNPLGSGASSAGFIALASVMLLRLACGFDGVKRFCRLMSRGNLEVSGLPADVFTSVFRQPVIITILLYLGWLALGLLWASPSTLLGLEDLISHRMLLLPLLLMPVLHHARALILAFLVGAVAVNMLQLLEWLEWPAWMEWRSFKKARRLGAFNNEIVTGLFLAVAICFWIRGHFIARRWWWLGLVPFLAICFVGLLLTGSRGPILAGAAAGLLSFLLPLIFVPQLRQRILIVGTVVCVLLVPSVALNWEYLGNRFQRVNQEWNERYEDPTSSVGKRWLMTEYGIACFKAQPLLGTGPGNARRHLPNEKAGETLMINGSPYEWDTRFELLQNPDAYKGESPDRLNLHSTYIQALVTLGLPGLLFLCCVLVAGLVSSWRLVREQGLVAATFFGIVAWMIAGISDSLQIGGSKLSTLGFLLSLSILGFKHARRTEASPDRPT